MKGIYSLILQMKSAFYCNHYMHSFCASKLFIFENQSSTTNTEQSLICGHTDNKTPIHRDTRLSSTNCNVCNVILNIRISCNSFNLVYDLPCTC